MIGRVDFENDVPNPVLPAPTAVNPISYANTIVPMTDFIDSCVAGDDPFFIWYAPFLPHSPLPLSLPPSTSPPPRSHSLPHSLFQGFSSESVFLNNMS